MRMILDVLRLRLDADLSERQTARSLGVPRTTVYDYLVRFRLSGLSWPLPPALDVEALERALFPHDAGPPAALRPLPSWAAVAHEKKRKGVTLQLLCQEYRGVERDGYSYSQFAEHYRRWRATLDPVLRQEYRAGERTFVDYAGLTVDVLDVSTGELRAAQLFVAALGASNYTYAEATWTQQLPDWIASHVRMVEHFGGASALTIPDNLRTGVTYASYYDPEINATYAEWAAHYGTAVLPTRVVSPRDKAKVETAAQIVEREILAPGVRVPESWCWELLVSWLRDRRLLPDARVFQLSYCATRRALKSACRAVGVDNYRSHDWRHTYAVQARRDGYSDQVIAHQLGHKTTAMVQAVYGRYTPTEADYRRSLTVGQTVGSDGLRNSAGQSAIR